MLLVPVLGRLGELHRLQRHLPRIISEALSAVISVEALTAAEIIRGMIARRRSLFLRFENS
jgi:hypothetical protein